MPISQNVKPALWGAVGGAIAAVIIGFVWGGWVTGGTAEKMAVTRSSAAVVEALVPACVALSVSDPAGPAKLEQLAALKSSLRAHGFRHEGRVGDDANREGAQPQTGGGLRRVDCQGSGDLAAAAF